MPKSPLKLVDEPSDEGVLIEEPAYNEEEVNLQRALELSLKDQGERTQGPACPITPKKKSHADQFIFQRHTPMPIEAFGYAESPSLDAELALTDSETESDNEGHAGPNTGNQDEGQNRPNPGDQDEGQAGSNLATDASTQQKPKQMDDEFTTTAYPNVQENLKLPTKDQEEEPGKTNAEAEVSQAVDEIVTDAVDWAMQALLQARFKDLPTVDMKEILQQRMFEDNSYKAQDVHNDLYEALSPPLQPPPPPPPTSASSAPGTSRASGLSQLLPSPPHLSTGTSRSDQQQGSKALSSSKTAASASQSMA
ncbi:retrovirus-related pol polyprotein from transposon TNT 1-94 [Tanacetum coccineum]